MNALGMSELEVWLIIILVIGVIISNLAILRYSAKFKLPQFGAPPKVTPKDDCQDGESQKTEDNTAESAQASSTGKGEDGQEGNETRTRQQGRSTADKSPKVDK